LVGLIYQQPAARLFSFKVECRQTNEWLVCTKGGREDTDGLIGRSCFRTGGQQQPGLGSFLSERLAGRGDRAGRVVIQTFFPEHFAILRAAKGEYAEFAREEIENRKALGYPPAGRIVKILHQGADRERVAAAAAKAADLLRKHAAGSKVLGAVPAPIVRIQGKHRFQILLKSPSAARLHAVLETLEASLPERTGVERLIDVDPQSML
jgi:primosomal protein N'